MEYINSEPPTIEERLPDVIMLINIAVESFRKELTNAGVMQSMVYQEKVDQATDFAAAGFSDASGFPLIEAEANIRGITAQAVAESIIEKRSQWNHMITQSEAIRLQGQEDAQAANTLDALEATIDDVKNNLSNIDLM